MSSNQRAPARTSGPRTRNLRQARDRLRGDRIRRRCSSDCSRRLTPRPLRSSARGIVRRPSRTTASHRIALPRRYDGLSTLGLTDRYLFHGHIDESPGKVSTMDFCDYDHQAREVRRLPIDHDDPAGSAIIVCYRHYRDEMDWRRQRNADHTLYERFVLPRWQDLEVYDGDTTKVSEGRNLEHETPSHTPAANPDRHSNARTPGSWTATS